MALVLPYIVVASIGGAPFSAVSGDGSTYVFSNISESENNDECTDWHTSSYELDDLLGGIFDEALCYEVMSFAGSVVDVTNAFSDSGFETSVVTEGATWGPDTSAFSRHDYDCRIVFDSAVQRRVKIDLSMYADGLGSVWLDLQRIGDAGGGGSSSPELIDESVNAYIEPITFDGSWVLNIPQGRWKVFIYSTHQCIIPSKGFGTSVVTLSFSVNIVSDGDVDGNGEVNATDLLAVIAAWGGCGSCIEDLNGDGVVDVADVLIVVGNW